MFYGIALSGAQTVSGFSNDRLALDDSESCKWVFLDDVCHKLPNSSPLKVSHMKGQVSNGLRGDLSGPQVSHKWTIVVLPAIKST